MSVSLSNTKRSVVPGGVPVARGSWVLSSAEARPDSLETTESKFPNSPPRASRTPLPASSASDAASTSQRLRWTTLPQPSSIYTPYVR